MNNATKNINIKYIALGLLLGITTTFICLFLFAIVIYYTNMSTDYVNTLSSVGMGFGCLIGSFYTSKKTKKNGMLMGSIISILLFILTLFSSLAIKNDGLTILSLIHLIVMILSGCIGGILGVNTKIKTEI